MVVGLERVGALSARPRSHLAIPTLASGARAAASTCGRTLGWGVGAQGHVLSRSGAAACSSLPPHPCATPSHAACRPPRSPEPLLILLEQSLPCSCLWVWLNGPRTWTLSRLRRAQNLSGSQTVFQRALGAGKDCRRGAEGYGRTGCLQRHPGASASVGLVEGRPLPSSTWGHGPYAHRSSGRSSAPRPAPLPPPLAQGCRELRGPVEWALRAGKQTLGGGGGPCSALCSPGAFLPGRPGRPFLQAVPDLQPQLRGVGQPWALHPDLTVAPALQPARYLAPPGPLTLREAGFLVFPAINQSLMYTRRVWVAGERWRTRPVRGGPWCPGRRVVARRVPLWVEGLWVKLTGTAEHVGPPLGIHVSVEQTHRWKEPGSSCSHGSGKRKAASMPRE